jgi:hypothetical protein
MFQPHSFLWHYLWVAPNVLLLLLSLLIWRRGIHRQWPVFFYFALLEATSQLTNYVADSARSISAATFWGIFWAGLLLEGIFKFAVIAEVFARLLAAFPAIADLGKWFIRGVGGTLVLAATLVVAYARPDSTFRLIWGAHLLAQTMYLVVTGLIVFLYIFAAHFRLRWDRSSFGILLGLGISASVHLATWAVAANADLSEYGRGLLDFVHMGTYHVCVMIWFYYLLLGADRTPTMTILRPEHDLAELNHELERLLQR